MQIAQRFILAASISLLATLGHARSFEEASPHLDLDGAFVAYINFEGDGTEIGTSLNAIYQSALEASPQMPPIPIDFTQMIDHLGFGSLSALAFSSKEVETGLHRNRAVALLNGELRGLYALYDTEPLSFTAAEMAPGNATGALTASINLRTLRDTTLLIAQQIMGPTGEGMVQQQLTQVIPNTDISYNEAIEILSGKWDAFWLQQYGDAFKEEFKFWVRIEGAGNLLPRLSPTLEGLGIPVVKENETIKVDLSSLLGANAEIELHAIAELDSGSLILYSDADWTARSAGPRLVSSESYQKLANRMPSQGIAFSYSAGTDLIPALAALNTLPEVAPYQETIMQTFNLFLGGFLSPNMSVTTLGENVMITEQYAGHSMKQTVMALPTIVGGGLTAAMAIPAFQKVRTTSQEKAVTNNLRQIASAADQYFLENGATEVHIDKLMGVYIRSLQPVAGESYEGMIIRQGEEIRVTLGDGREISLPF